MAAPNRFQSRVPGDMDIYMGEGLVSANNNSYFMCPPPGPSVRKRTSDPAGYRWRLSSMLWDRFAMVSTLRSVISIEAGFPCTAAEIPLLNIKIHITLNNKVCQHMDE